MIRTRQNWTQMTKMRSTKWRHFRIARSIRESQNQAIYQASTIWFLGKGYLEEENTWESASTVQHLRKLISSFHKNYSDKSTAIFPAIDTISPMARPTAKPIEFLKQKQEQLIRRTTKCDKWDNKEESKSVWFSIEPKAGKRLKICLSNAKSIGESTFWWMESFAV